jgi:uncharacterized protein
MGVLRIGVRVKPGSSRAKVGGTYGVDGALVVAVNARPVDGAATEAVLAAIADALRVSRRHVSLVSGATSRSKVVAVEVPDDDEARLRTDVERLRAL